MFIYLSKKIAIPNNNKIKDIAWSSEHKFIACSGENGLLKVIKLDSILTNEDGTRKEQKSLTASKNLSMNQSLEGHNGDVLAVCWNETYQKLTSSDQNGLIIVWMLYKGNWYEEMINNRNKTIVKGIAWTSDGNKICIVYDDGAVIVGSVDGNRLWGKELKGMRFSQVEWSPDAKLILIGVLDCEIHVYDHTGNFINKIPLPAIQGYYGQSNRISHGSSTTLIGIKWFSGIVANNFPTLAIAFENGRIQLMKNESDESPIIVDAEMSLSCIRWNYYGTMLAVSGQVKTEMENKRNQVKFFNQQGELIQMLKVPGKELNSCSWEREGLRIALAVDSYIFFANIRPDYKWCYFGSTIVYTSNVMTNDPTSGLTNMVIFWNIPSDNRHIKSVKNLQQIAGYGNYCVYAYKLDNADNKNSNNTALNLCNEIGNPVDMINIDQEVNFLSVTNTKVIAASKFSFCIWKFNIPTQWNNTKHLPSNRLSVSDLEFEENSEENKLSIIFVSRNDPINCICATEKCLVVGQESGQFQQYLLHNLTNVYRFNLNCLPAKIQLNRDSTKLAIIDISGTLCVYDFDSNQNDDSQGKLLQFERKDVWGIKWANDNEDMLAINEKTKIIVFNMQTFEPEDPITSSGYICQFNDLTVKTILLDELINDENESEASSQPTSKIEHYIVDYETKSLRDARQLFEKVEIAEASEYIKKQTHPRLWRLFAQYAMNALDLNAAELALVKCKDYKGIQFIKRINQLKNDPLKRAEIHIYNQEFDEAEKIYLDIDRRDLAIQMRQILGDWEKVIELLKNDLATSNDNKLRDAMCNLGDYYADNNNWQEAAIYYEKCEAYDKLFECYCILENYEDLKLLINKFNNNHPILVEFGKIFESVGMSQEAVQAYIKAKKVDLAINCCVTMSEWKIAIDLAHEYNVPNIDSLLAKYAQHLLKKGKYFDIVELYRKANKINDAESMLLKIIDDTKKEKPDPILLKKLYVLIGFLHEKQKTPSKDRKTSTLNSLLNEESFTDTTTDLKLLDDPWKGAEAFHFLILCQRQLYEGYYDAAMKTALHLRDYDDFIETEEIFCLLALSSCANRSFSICSKAFIKLESCNSIPKERQEIYSNLAIDIFTKNPPKDSKNSTKSECTYCETMIADWCTVCPSCHVKFPICIASGRPIMDPSQQWACSRCNHHAYKSDIVTFTNCPLCHKNLLQKK